MRRLATTADGGPPVVVHVSQEIVVHRPLLADEAVTVGLEVTGARREGGGVRMALRGTVAGATPIADLVTTVRLGGATGPEPFGAMPPLTAPAAGEPGEPQTVTTGLSVATIRRYAEVSGDHNPIHLDDAAARAAGFDGVIAHGMSVLALVTEAAADRFAGGDPARVRSVGCRFSAPVLPGEPLEITFRPDAEGAVVGFACATPRGTALKGGWVAFRAGGDD